MMFVIILEVGTDFPFVELNWIEFIHHFYKNIEMRRIQ